MNKCFKPEIKTNIPKISANLLTVKLIIALSMLIPFRLLLGKIKDYSEKSVTSS